MENKTETVSDNELIAEFMWGLKEHPSKYQYYGDVCGEYVWTNLPGITVTPFLEYDTSWDWLMPVCIKLKIEYICTDIKKAYEQVIQKIKEGEMGTGS